MSFDVPNQAIPTFVYSHKASFETERTPLVIDPDTGAKSGDDPIADQYTLMIKKSSDSDSEYTHYVLSRDAKFVYVDFLEPQTLYTAKWKLTGSLNEDLTVDDPDEETESTPFVFKTRHNERFIVRPAIPFPLGGTDFPAALQAELDEHINYINTLEDENAIERFKKEGVGRIGDPDDRECELRIIGGSELYMTNGYFQSGSGLESDDAKWYPGAKFWQVADPNGLLSLNDISNTLPTNNVGEYYGYMGAYLDENGNTHFTTIWSKDFITPRPNGRWCIGKVKITESGAYNSVDLTKTDLVPSIQYILTHATGGSSSPDTSGGAAKIQLNYIHGTTDSISYDSTTDGWKELLVNKTFTVDKDNAVLAISLLTGTIFNPITGLTEAGLITTRIVIDSESLTDRKEIHISREAYFDTGVNPLSGNSTLYLDDLSTGEHTIKIEVEATNDGIFEVSDLRLEVVEFTGDASTSTGTTVQTARTEVFNPQDADDPQQTTYSYVKELEERLTTLINDKIDAINPGQTLSLSHFVADFARGLIGQGEIHPSSLLRIDGAFIIPEVYGQGETITVDGDSVSSPKFAGEGTLIYDADEDAWVV